MHFRILSALLICAIVTGSAAAAISVENLQCESAVNSLGIATTTPRFSWIMQSEDRGQRQTGYQIMVASTEAKLLNDKADVWDSQRVASDASTFVSYAGRPLLSRDRCFWKVRIWDRGGKVSDWSSPARWSIGLLSQGDWTAKWIGNKPVKRPLETASWIWFPEGNPRVSAPLGKRYFRRVVTLIADQVVSSARCYIAADNSFELFVNGKAAGSGDDWENPRTIDIAPLLQAGENVIGVAAMNIGEAPNPAGLIAEIQIVFATGDPILVVTDHEWETARKVDKQWGKAGNDKEWVNARVLGPYSTSPWTIEGLRRSPAICLRRQFAVEKTVERATVYCSGLGFSDFYLNGKPISDGIMNPALSDYRKAAYYQTFDVTAAVIPGQSTLGAVLGNGRYFAPRTDDPLGEAPHTATYGDPTLRLQMEIEYSDGSTARIISDDSWKLTLHGPIVANNEYDGEEYDARLEMNGWDQNGYNDAGWVAAELLGGPAGEMVPQSPLEPMRITEVIKPVGITNPRPGVFVVDMGQNFYGTVRLKVHGPAGAVVRMTSAYSLLPDGTLKTGDNRSAQSRDVYTLKGGGEEIWNPRFRGQGFRRVQVEGFPGTPTAENFSGLVIHSDCPPTGDFACSNELINRIHQSMKWGMRMFLRSAPVDPDRDERQPWLGDPAKDAESEAYNFGVDPFYAKFMGDIRRSQRVDGTIPDVSFNWHGGRGVEWPSVFTIVPDWMADFYGDHRVAEQNYDAMKKWVQAMKIHQNTDGTLKATSYGDWCDTYTMNAAISDFGMTSRSLISTAYQYHNCCILAKLAGRLNHPDDVTLFDEQAAKLKEAFNRIFFDASTHHYQSGTQCSYILPLAFGLVPPEHREAVIANLINDIMVEHHGHLTVGLIGMQWMMQVLTDIGRPDVAWTIATQTTRPSWGFMLAKGATTIWERWDYDTRDPGMNSEALLIQAGNLDAWFYQTLAGINYDPQNPGFKHIVIRPQPVGDLTWAKAHFNCPFGWIESSWNKQDGVFTLDVTIPANTTATIYLPAAEKSVISESEKPVASVPDVHLQKRENGVASILVGSGKYHFVVR